VSRKTKAIATAVALTALTAFVLILELSSSINGSIDACADPTARGYIQDDTLRKQKREE